MLDNTYDVCIIGAGIVGCSTAWELTQRGAKVILIEENAQLFQGASLAGFGSLTPFSDPFFDGEARDYAAKSIELYRNLWIENIGKNAGINITFKDLGLIELCESKADFIKSCEHAERLIKANYSRAVEILSVDETLKREPNLLGNFQGAIWLDEPWLDKDEYFKAFEIALNKLPNLSLLFNTRVSSITSSSTHVEVITDNKGVFHCEQAIICTGISPLGIENMPVLPLRWIRGDAVGVYTKDNQPLIQRHIYMKNGFITPRMNGYMLLGATYDEEQGIPSEYARRNRNRIEISQLNNLIESNVKILPGLVNCEIEKVWRGWRPSPKDNFPILGPLTNYPNIIIATGFIGLGITMAPATAHCIADYCLENKKLFPIIFDPNRFMS